MDAVGQGVEIVGRWRGFFGSPRGREEREVVIGWAIVIK
jgi:hypothetical protein